MCKKRKILLFLVLLFTLLFGPFSIAWADNFICPPDNRIISTGDTMYDVQALCAPPAAKNQRTLYSGSKRSFGTVVVDEWTYDMGPNRFRATLIFHNGVLVEIVTSR